MKHRRAGPDQRLLPGPPRGQRHPAGDLEERRFSRRRQPHRHPAPDGPLEATGPSVQSE